MNNRMKCFLIVFLGMLAAMAPLSTDMYLPALPEFSNDFHISASLAQLTLTMTLIGMAVGQILGGPVSDYLGRRNPLLLGMAVFTAASVLCSITSSIHMFLGLRLIQGIAGAFGIVISRAIARDVASGPELLQFYSILMMVNGLAPIAAPVIGGQILRFTSWHGIFFRYGCGRRSDVLYIYWRIFFPVSEHLSRIGAGLQLYFWFYWTGTALYGSPAGQTVRYGKRRVHAAGCPVGASDRRSSISGRSITFCSALV